MFIVSMLAALALAGDPGTPAPVEETSEATAEVVERASKSAKADADRLVCRREAKANSRFTTKVCKTAAEWEERAEAARRAFAETQQRPTVMICPPTGC